ncbi:hypothetical protein [Actinomadura roseirufa]|uniref:hypothetical protein n=1 Tax=Actinomadura roseirufa TaxID=2094049 RepID=UPI0010412F5C|nr:hypothetical protein [Actinomadura roseirufa]
MKITKLVLVSVPLGGAFGAATSWINDFSSPYRSSGGRVEAVSGGVRSVAEVVSLLVDVGWAWAGLAVAVGWLARTPVRGSIAGVMALTAATAAYYRVDSYLLEEPFAWHQGLMVFWWTVGLVTGLVLGAVGAAARRTGTIGLLTGLTVPVGALLQMAVMPPGFGPTENPEAVWALVIVCVGATAAAAFVFLRFFRGAAPGEPSPDPPPAVRTVESSAGMAVE